MQANHGKAHFQTLHGKFGLCTFLTAVAVAGGGLVSFRRMGLITRLPGSVQPKVKWLHRSVSCSIRPSEVIVFERRIVSIGIRNANTHHTQNGLLQKFWCTTCVLGYKFLTALHFPIAGELVLYVK